MSKKCTRCGAENKKENNYCTICGKKFDEREKLNSRKEVKNDSLQTVYYPA
ncbi:zinc-ribbon domain-containing protein [Enterococcus cecorum]|uniref:zinc-ribbon domain-containing protein n=1 Tax=Enterococcus cecorum TaxID=44008 RepID=UPI0038FC2CC6